ncbi:glycosyltransferase family 2 protein [Actinoplanes sp. NPDC049265]|uniref:glycosyltransferase family 2 protein n=1 Tax=Actinoplanes sp. NPDC049265 TaxID=3363902 RepID=UPI0037144DE2
MEADQLLEAHSAPPVVPRVGDRRRVTSVVVACAPGPELIGSVRSLTAQSWTNQEILLYDDGSPHGHDGVFRSAAALDPRVRLIRLPANVGVYAARNLALARATGDYVTFQDPDAWSHPLRLERQVHAVGSGAGVGCHAVLNGSVVRGPLLVRRGAGDFDEVRHGGDDEYTERLGLPALADVLCLLRSPVPAHLVPALRAYRSAYRAWHRRPAASPCRPWPLLERRGRRAYDVLLVADWTRPDAGLGQFQALRSLGLRMALLHHSSSTADLDPAVQHAVNDGQAEQVDLTDDVRARLVVVRDPAVLLTPPSVPSGIRATRLILEGAATPRCAAEARELFHAEPLWAPAGPHSRQALSGLPLTPVDVPATVAAGQWRLDRRPVRAGRPVAGVIGSPAELPAEPGIDLRLLDGSSGVPGGLPSWLVYRSLDLRAFLHQLDFYLPLPAEATPADPTPAVLAAMAAGCVVVLPPRYRSTFGDAAVYSAAPTDAVRSFPAASLPAQRDRAVSFVRTHHQHDRYAAQILALTP